MSASHEHRIGSPGRSAAGRPVMLELPGMAPTPLTAELVSKVEAALREHRRRGSGSRDYAGEIEAFLTGQPGASTIEIARGICARDAAVRSVLKDDSVFEQPRDARKRVGRVNRWTLVTAPAELVPKRGTGSPAGGATT